MPPGHDVFLIGFSGSGKSTVGPRLAKLLKARYLDSDSLIEKRTGCSISDIFRVNGEAYFRRVESEAIADLARQRGRRKVIALGGGALENTATIKRVKESGLLIYLSCSRRELYRRLRNVSDRPLMDVTTRIGETMRQARLRRIGQLLKQRLCGYRRADLIYATTNKSPGKAARDLYKFIRKHDADR